MMIAYWGRVVNRVLAQGAFYDWDTPFATRERPAVFANDTLDALKRSVKKPTKSRGMTDEVLELFSQASRVLNIGHDSKDDIQISYFCVEWGRQYGSTVSP
jgi:hypothetical protein